MQLIVITGLSGAGKGLATRHFEDFGFFCVDNLPPMLIPSFAELLERGKIGKAALVVDVRGGEFFPELIEALDDLEERELDFKTLFLDCDDDALLTRFQETRRKHPLDNGGGLTAAIERERELLVPLRERADKVVNTSRVTPRELRSEIERTFVALEDATGLLVQVESFGFKHGPHASADLVFDVRFLPNPNYDRDIGHLDGYAPPVIDYVMREPMTQEFLGKWQDFLSFVVPQFQNEGKAYLTIAVGCTGGRHRSVALSNWLAAWLEAQGFRVKTSHRDLARGAHNAPFVFATGPNASQTQTFGLPLSANESLSVAQKAQNFHRDTPRGVGDTLSVPIHTQTIDGDTKSAPISPRGIDRDTQSVPNSPQTIDGDTKSVSISPRGIDRDTQSIVGDVQSIPNSPRSIDGGVGYVVGQAVSTDEDVSFTDEDVTLIGEDTRR